MNEPSKTSVEKLDIGADDEFNNLRESIPTFDQKASLQIALWVLLLFAFVYLFCFIFGFCMLSAEGASFDGVFEYVKFMLTSILPLVTLAVGYYLGDKSNMKKSLK